jgi:NitT/TauT family transport system substrate-binding protein
MRGGGAIIAGVLLVAAACGGGPQTQRLVPTATPTLDRTPVTVRVGHVASPLYDPLYLALGRGYFTQLDVTVQLQQVRPGQDLVDLLARGEVDAAVTDFGAALFNGLGRGVKYRVVGSMAAVPATGTSPVALEVSKKLVDSGRVKAPADLKGHAIVIEGGAGSGNGYLASAVLQPAGVSLKDMTVGDLALASMEPAVKSGGVDAALAIAPYSTAMERDGVTVPIGAPPPGSAWSGLVYGPKLGASAGQRFFQALVRAERDLAGPAGTSDDTLAILAKYTGRPVDQLKAAVPFDWTADLRPDPAGLAAIQATYRGLGLLRYGADLPPGGFVDDSFSRRAATALH